MKKLLALVLLPVALASAGDPMKSRWRSLTTGNLFEVTDYGDRLSIRFLANEVVEDQGTEKPDVSVSLNGPKQQIMPGRWLLQKTGEGKYAGTANQQINCQYWRELHAEWATHVCTFADHVELSMTGNAITGWRDGDPANKAKFDCGKCKFSKVQRGDFEWALEGAPAASGPAAAAPAVVSVAAAPAATGTFAIESTPAAAEVYIDGEFVGSTPMEHTLTAGKHEIELKKKGQAPWKRTLSVNAGAKARVTAELEPQS